MEKEMANRQVLNDHKLQNSVHQTWGQKNVHLVHHYAVNSCLRDTLLGGRREPLVVFLLWDVANFLD